MRVGISLRANIRFYDNLHLPIPLVSGALHWKASIIEGEEKNRSDENIIVSFDVNSEKFRKLAVPDALFYESSLALFKGKLAVITYGCSEQSGCFRFSIWVMREYGVFESWNKLFVGPLEGRALCFAFTNYGSLLICRFNGQITKLKVKEVLIDTETRHEKDPGIKYPSSVATFMESLVLLDVANVVSY
jgi:hypothetical protein